MANKIDYEVIGRYMMGAEVTGYEMRRLDDRSHKKYSKEQVCYLVGKGQVVNCTGRLYDDKVILEGNGISLIDLPVQQERKETNSTTNSGTNSSANSGIKDNEVKNIYIKEIGKTYARIKHAFPHHSIKCNENIFEVAYYSDYFRFSTDGNKIIIQWSAGNGADGGKTCGYAANMPVTEVVQFAANAFSKMVKLVR